MLAGVHPKVVSERHGHASTQITLDRYSHVLASMQEAAADTIGRFLQSDSFALRVVACSRRRSRSPVRSCDCRSTNPEGCPRVPSG